MLECFSTALSHHLLHTWLNFTSIILLLKPTILSSVTNINTKLFTFCKKSVFHHSTLGSTSLLLKAAIFYSVSLVTNMNSIFTSCYSVFQFYPTITSLHTWLNFISIILLLKSASLYSVTNMNTIFTSC